MLGVVITGSSDAKRSIIAGYIGRIYAPRCLLLLYSLVHWLALQEGQILGASWEVNDALGSLFVPVNCPRAEFPTVSQAHDSKGSDQGQGERKGAG